MRLHGRWSLGLPASTIDLGNVDEIGRVNRNREVQADFLIRGFLESQVLETVEAAMVTGSPSLQIRTMHYHPGIDSTENEESVPASWQRMPDSSRHCTGPEKAVIDPPKRPFNPCTEKFMLVLRNEVSKIQEDARLFNEETLSISHSPVGRLKF